PGCACVPPNSRLTARCRSTRSWTVRYRTPPLVCEAPESVWIFLDSPLESCRDNGVVEARNLGTSLPPTLPVGAAFSGGGGAAAFFAFCGLSCFAFWGFFA